MLGKHLLQLRLPSGHQPFPLTHCMRLWVPFPILWPAFELVTFSSNCNLYTRRLIWAPTLSGQIWGKTWAKIFWSFWLGFPFWSPKLTNHARYLYFPTRIIYLNTGIGTALVGLLQVMQKRFWSYLICYSAILIKFHRRVTKTLACGIHVESTQRSWTFRRTVMTNWILIGVSSKFYNATGLSNHRLRRRNVKRFDPPLLISRNLQSLLKNRHGIVSTVGIPRKIFLGLWEHAHHRGVLIVKIYPTNKSASGSLQFTLTSNSRASSSPMLRKGTEFAQKWFFFQTYVQFTNVLSW